jgi:hypothetical protein
VGRRSKPTGHTPPVVRELGVKRSRHARPGRRSLEPFGIDVKNICNYDDACNSAQTRSKKTEPHRQYSVSTWPAAMPLASRSRTGFERVPAWARQAEQCEPLA